MATIWAVTFQTNPFILSNNSTVTLGTLNLKAHSNSLMAYPIGGNGVYFVSKTKSQIGHKNSGFYEQSLGEMLSIIFMTPFVKFGFQYLNPLSSYLQVVRYGYAIHALVLSKKKNASFIVAFQGLRQPTQQHEMRRSKHECPCRVLLCMFRRS